MDKPIHIDQGGKVAVISITAPIDPRYSSAVLSDIMDALRRTYDGTFAIDLSKAVGGRRLINIVIPRQTQDDA